MPNSPATALLQRTDTEPPHRSDRVALLRSRYRQDTGTAEAPWNEVLASLLGHRSVRSYRLDPLPVGTLETLIAAAQSAASSSNLQTWSVVAVEDPERKARLSALASGQKHIVQAPLFLVWLADLARLASIAEESGTEPAGLSYLETMIVGIVDTALAAQNAVVAAESLGLGTVYIGAIRNQPEQVAAELGLPPQVFPVFGLCIGYEAAGSPAAIKPRLPQSAVLHRERYAQAKPGALIPAYDEAIRDFYREQGIEAPAWSRTVVDRVKAPEALSGRHRLREALNSLGFPLR